jgi:hypothetical protein
MRCGSGGGRFTTCGVRGGGATGRLICGTAGGGGVAPGPGRDGFGVVVAVGGPGSGRPP